MVHKQKQNSVISSYELARGTEQLITESLNVYKLMFTLYGEFGLKIEMKLGVPNHSYDETH